MMIMDGTLLTRHPNSNMFATNLVYEHYSQRIIMVKWLGKELSTHGPMLKTNTAKFPLHKKGEKRTS